MADDVIGRELISRAESLLDRLNISGEEHPDIIQVSSLIKDLITHQKCLEFQISDLIQVKNSMEENQHRYVYLFDDAPIGYVILNSKGRIIQFNKAFLKMIGNENILSGQTLFSNLLNEKDAQSFNLKLSSENFFSNKWKFNVGLLHKENRTVNVQLEIRGHEKSGRKKSLQEVLVTVTRVDDPERVDY